jgi:hypothetical protein
VESMRRIWKHPAWRLNLAPAAFYRSPAVIM